VTDNNNPIIEFPEWLWEPMADGQSYLERSGLLNKLVEYLQAGKSDEDIARTFGSTEDKVHAWRTNWYLYRTNECPNCGERDYEPDPGWVCPNRRCISNWGKRAKRGS